MRSRAMLNRESPLSRKYVQIRHSASDSLIAEGPLGWGITPFIWFRVAVPGAHPEISVERYEKSSDEQT